MRFNFRPMERKDSKKHKRTHSLKKPKKSAGDGTPPSVVAKPVNPLLIYKRKDHGAL